MNVIESLNSDILACINIQKDQTPATLGILSILVTLINASYVYSWSRAAWYIALLPMNVDGSFHNDTRFDCYITQSCLSKHYFNTGQ